MAKWKPGRGKDSKGNPGVWKKRNGKKIFVADTKRNNNKPVSSRGSSKPSASGARLPVARFKTWSPDHQRQALKFYGETTPEEFWKMRPDQQRVVMERVRTRYAVARAPDSANKPQSLTDIYKAAESTANLKYLPAEKEIGNQQRASDAQQGRISQWFGQYQQQLKDIQAQTSAAYSAAQQAVQGNADRSTTLDAQQRQAMTAAMQADAAQRGATVDPSLEALAQQAAASRRASADTQAGTIASQGATNTAYQLNRQGIATNQQIAEHMKETNVRKNLAKDLTDLLKEKGEFEGATRQDLIAAERKNILERAAFQLDTAEAAAKTATEANKLNKYGFTNAEWAKLSEKEKNRYRSGRAKPRSTQGYGPGRSGLNKYGFTHKEWTAMSEKERARHRAGKGSKKDEDKPRSGPGSLTPDQENRIVSKVNGYRAQMENPPVWPNDPAKYGSRAGKRATPEEVRRELLSSGADRNMVMLADSLRINRGRIGPNGIKSAHALGLHVGGRWKSAPKPKPPRRGASPATSIPGLGQTLR